MSPRSPGQGMQRWFLPVILSSVILPLLERNETGKRGPLDEVGLPIDACLLVCG